MLELPLVAALAAAFALGVMTPTVSGDLERDGLETIDLGGEDGAGALAIQPDGKILVGGGTSDGRERSRWVLLRLDDGGRLDPTFGRRGLVAGPTGAPYGGYDEIGQIALMADGRIVVAGTRGDEVGVARYRADGSFDATFGAGDGFTVISKSDSESSCNTPSAIAVRPDGGTDIAMNVGCGGESGDDPAIEVVRLDASGRITVPVGSPAVRFPPDGAPARVRRAPPDHCFTYAKDAAVTVDHRILIAGYRRCGKHADITLVRPQL